MTPTSQSGAQPMSGRHPSVLLVEDDDLLRELYAEGLSLNGMSVDSAASAEEALDIWRERDGAFDVIVTDIVMPGMQGTELASRLRRQSPELAVLLITGFADAETLEETKAYQLLTKPFSLASLLDAIAQLR